MAHVRRARSGRGWEARYRDAAYRELSRTFPTKRAAEDFLARQLADMQRGDYIDPRRARTTFEHWAEEWLGTTVHLRPATRVGYESILSFRILPTFGKAKIGAIEQVDIRRFVPTSRRGAQPQAPSGIRSRFSAWCSALRWRRERSG